MKPNRKQALWGSWGNFSGHGGGKGGVAPVGTLCAVQYIL